MRFTLRTALSVCFFVVFACGVSAFAEDLTPPSWRGNPGTTYAEWDFDPGSEPFDPLVPADAWVGPGDPPIAEVELGPLMDYQEEWGGREGVVPLSGTITIVVPNYPSPSPYKEVWLQLTWAAQDPGKVPSFSADAPGYVVHDAVLVNELVLELTDPLIGLPPPPPGGSWMHSTYSIIIEPNPNFETVTISGSIMVDQVLLETWCVPEPATLSLLGLGGLVLVALRRRK